MRLRLPAVARTPALPPLLLGALLCGCALAPEYERPDLPVPERFEDAGPATTLDATALPGWRRFFPEPRLQALIAAALEHNRDLRVAVSRVAEARAQFRLQQAAELPEIDVSASAIRGELADRTAPLIGDTRIEQYSAALAVPAYELDFWGRIASLKRAALERYLATAEAQRAFALSLTAQVADAYLQGRELDERIELAQRTLASREESFRIAERRLALGDTSELQLRQAQSLLTSARAELAALQQARDRNRHALRQLVGTWPADLPDAKSLESQGIVGDLPPGLPAELLVRRPDLRAAEARLRAANADIGAARAAFLPQITLTGTYGTGSDELDGLFDAGTDSWLFVPRLSLPLFDHGRRRANLDLAAARRNTAVAEYEAAIQQAFREVRDALSSRYWIEARIAALRDTVAAQEARLRIAELSYENGAVAYLEVLDAQRQLFAVRQTLIEARRAALSNAVALYLALGGGPYGPPGNAENAS